MIIMRAVSVQIQPFSRSKKIIMKTYILGNSGFAREIFEQIVTRNNKINFGGFIILDDNKPFVIGANGSYEFDYPVHSCFMLGTSNKKWRTTFVNHFKQFYPITSTYFPTFSAYNAHISKLSVIGVGNIFCSFSLVNGNAQIGDFNCFNVYSTISHDCCMGNHNIMNPYSGIMGYSTIGNNNVMDTHSTITNKLRVGNNNNISAGECLFDNLHDNQLFQSGVIYNKP